MACSPAWVWDNVSRSRRWIPLCVYGKSQTCGYIAEMSKVDVIIPAYNAAKYLPTAIESVMAQTFEDWTIVLVDDGSTDNTAEAVAPYLKQLGPKLRYVKQANAGLPAARNAAIRNSSSEFLALL